MKRLILTMTTVLLLLALVGILAGPIMSNVEQPVYKTLSIYEDEGVEIRLYEPLIVAETTVSGKREVAVRKGFNIIADYIFGNNVVSQDIAMTAPVEQQNKSIAMTAPVEQQASVELDVWQVRFVMPSEYTLQSLPKPNNDQILLYEVPSKRFAVIRFSGRLSQSNLKRHENKLLEYIAQAQLEMLGQPKYAFYNPPWTLPLLRRNEVMIELK